MMSVGFSREELERVYGPLDEEVRECLNNVSSTDPEIADDAVLGLVEVLVGGRVVGPVTLTAIPYVVDLVEAGVGDTAGLLWLVGSIADENDEVDMPGGFARATVANELPPADAGPSGSAGQTAGGLRGGAVPSARDDRWQAVCSLGCRA